MMNNAPPYTSYAPPQTGPRIGEWISEAFTHFSREWLTWIGQGAILVFLGPSPVVVGYILFIGSMVAAAASSGGSGSDAAAAGAALVGVGILSIGGLLATLLSSFLLIGMKKTAAKQLRGEPISVRDMFSGGDVFLPSIGVALVSGICIGLGLGLCLVPGLVLAGLWCLTLPLVVDKRIGVFDALRESLNATRPNMWMWVVWFIVISLLAGAGSVLAGIGMIATYPIAMIAMMIAYRDTIGMAGAVPPATAVPTVPMTPATNYGPAGAPIATARCPACERPVAAGAVMCPHCQASIPSGYTGPSGYTPPPSNPGGPGV